MNLDIVRDAYQIYQIENKIRKKLIESILKNDKQGIIDNQRRYIKVANIADESLAIVLNKLSFNEINSYIQQTINNPEYRELCNFFMLLLSYNQLSNSYNNGNRFGEHKDSLYFNLVKWYVQYHYISDSQRNNLINEVIDTTSSSVSVRNILINREDINSKFETLNIRNEVEGSILFKMFVKEVEIFVLMMNSVILKQSLSLGNSIPKTLILRLVLLNLITKEFNLGFSIEEYINGYYERHDVMKEILNLPFDAGNKVLKLYVDDLILEVNDITNEFLNQKKK